MLVRNGEAALPGASAPLRVDIRVREGRVSEIAERLEPEAGEETVDASGLLVLPGAVDSHVHFDTPGFTERESFLRGSAEALRGGVTTIIDMPCTSLPPVVNAAALRSKLAAVAPEALCDYAFYGGIRGAGPDGPATAERDLEELAAAGVAGFKAYLASGMDTFPAVDHEQLSRMIAKAAELGLPVLVHAEDPAYVLPAAARIKAARGSGAPTWDDYVDSRPEAAELVACAALMALARGREGTLHVVHVGTAAAAELVSRSGGTCETCAHYLAFSREDFAAKGASLKTAPPVKSAAERERLWTLLASGAVSFATSDHAPARPEEKRGRDAWSAYGGIPGVGTTLPFLLSEGWLKGKLSLPRLLEASGAAQAARFGLSARKGAIALGKDADLVLFDPKGRTTMRAERLYSKGRDTPFDGLGLQGSIRSVYLRGRLAYDAARDEERPGALPREGSISEAAPGVALEPGFGRFLSRGCP